MAFPLGIPLRSAGVNWANSLRYSTEAYLTAAIRVMDASLGRLTRCDGRLQCHHREPGVDRAVDGPTHDPARPSVDYQGDVHETADHGDVSDVGNPDLVGTVRRHRSSEIADHRLSVGAVRSGDEAPATRGLQVVFSHQPPRLLAVDHDPLVAERRADATVAVGFELVAKSPDPGDDLGVVRRDARRVVVGGTRQAHRLTSPGDGHAEGPASANVGPLSGGALFF